MRKHIKTCSTLLIIKELKIKSINEIYILTKMTKIKQTDNCQVKDAEQLELSYVAVEQQNRYSFLGKQFGSF